MLIQCSYGQNVRQGRDEGRLPAVNMAKDTHVDVEQVRH